MKNTLYATFMYLLCLATSAALLQAANPPKQVLEDGQDPSGLSALVDLSRAEISLPALPLQNQAEKNLAAREKQPEKKRRKKANKKTKNPRQKAEKALPTPVAPTSQKSNSFFTDQELKDMENFARQTQQEEVAAGKKETDYERLCIRWLTKKNFLFQSIVNLYPKKEKLILEERETLRLIREKAQNAGLIRARERERERQEGLQLARELENSLEKPAQSLPKIKQKQPKSSIEISLPPKLEENLNILQKEATRLIRIYAGEIGLQHNLANLHHPETKRSLALFLISQGVSSKSEDLKDLLLTQDRWLHLEVIPTIQDTLPEKSLEKIRKKLREKLQKTLKPANLLPNNPNYSKKLGVTRLPESDEETQPSLSVGKSALSNAIPEAVRKRLLQEKRVQERQEQKRQESLRQHQLQLLEQRQLQEKESKRLQEEKSAQLVTAMRKLDANRGDAACFANFRDLYLNPSYKLVGTDVEESTPLLNILAERHKKQLGHNSWNPEKRKHQPRVDDAEPTPRKGQSGKSKNPRAGHGNQVASKPLTHKQVLLKKAMAERTTLKQQKPEQLSSEPPMTPAQRNLWSRDVEQLAPPAPAPSPLISEPKAPEEDEAKKFAAPNWQESAPIAIELHKIRYGDGFIARDPHADKHHCEGDTRKPDEQHPNGCYRIKDKNKKGTTFYPSHLSRSKLQENISYAIEHGIPFIDKDLKTKILGEFPPNHTGHPIYILAVIDPNDPNKIRTDFSISKKAHQNKNLEAQDEQIQHERALLAIAWQQEKKRKKELRLATLQRQKELRLEARRQEKLHLAVLRLQQEEQPQELQPEQESRRQTRSLRSILSLVPKWGERSFSPAKQRSPSSSSSPDTPPLTPPMPSRPCEESVWQDPLPAREEIFHGVGPQGNLPPDNWTLDNWTLDNWTLGSWTPDNAHNR